MESAESKSLTPDTATKTIEGDIRALVRGNRPADAPGSSDDAISAGATSIADIEKLMAELLVARDYLQSEGDRVRRINANYRHLAETASASVKIIAETIGKWRISDEPANQGRQGHRSFEASGPTRLRGSAVSTVTPKGPPLPFRARSYMAFVLAPQQPIPDWLADLDASIECSKGIYSHHPVALDMSAVNLNPDEIAHLIANLSERSIRVLGIEGITPDGAEGTLPPILRAGRVEQPFQLPDQTVVVNSVAEKHKVGVAASRGTRSLGAVDSTHRRRRHGARFCRIRGRNNRRRLNPHLRNTAWACIGGYHR